MSIYKIDTESGKIWKDDILIVSAPGPIVNEDKEEEKTKDVNNSKTPIDILSPYIGTVEYNGVVEEIQKWYYGRLVKAPWCATTVSWVMNKLGKLSYLDGKHENVYHMYNGCIAAGKGVMYTPNNLPDGLIKKNDILFFLWSGTKMTVTSNKHVTFSNVDCSISQNDNEVLIPTLGGNQNGKIQNMSYSSKSLYGIFRFY